MVSERKLPQAKWEQANMIIKEIEEDRAIEPSISPWSSPELTVNGDSV